jgi:hypothetical protein
MSRLIINITHENTGQLSFGVQSDNADQQVALLQHQLGDAMRKADEPAAADPRIGELETIVESQRREIAEALETVAKTRAELAEAKKPKRRR